MSELTPEHVGPSARPRDLALSALMDRAGNVSAHLARLLAQRHPSPADASLARELAFGVLRHRRTLDVILALFQPHKNPPPERVQQVLRIGAYQLVFLQRVPDFAAVNEAVGQIGKRSIGLRGFVNAVLRNLARGLSSVQEGPPPLEANVIISGPGTFRRMDRAIFPDPVASPAAYAADAFSLPDDLAARWLEATGGLAKVRDLALHANARPPVILRVDTRRISVDDVLARLRGQGIEAMLHANGLSVVVNQPLDVTALDLFQQALVSPQDAMATSVVAAADVKPGMQVVDLCSSPGTKTVQLAQRMENQGRIVALDVSQDKLDMVRESCRRAGITIVETMLAPEAGRLVEQPFDLVLVDAPCSNTGVLSRRPEARWRFTDAMVRALSQDQRHLVLLGAQMVRSGGRLLYSTCSLERQENADVVAVLPEKDRTFHLVKQQAISPAGSDDPASWSDGGYYAILRRT